MCSGKVSHISCFVGDNGFRRRRSKLTKQRSPVKMKANYAGSLNGYYIKGNFNEVAVNSDSLNHRHKRNNVYGLTLIGQLSSKFTC